jgi:hypothetical protein
VKWGARLGGVRWAACSPPATLGQRNGASLLSLVWRDVGGLQTSPTYRLGYIYTGMK